MPVASNLTATSFADTGLAAGTKYFYKVTAVNAAGSSPASVEASAVTQGAIAPTALVFAPTDDASVDSSQPTANFGSSGRITVDNSPTTYSLLKFSVNGTAGCPITNAKLRLTVGSTAYDNSVYGGDVYGTASTWSESTVTWNSAPVATTTKISSVASTVNLNTSYLFDVTPLITGDGTVSILIKSINDDGARYYSKEGGGTPAQLPQLQLTCG